MGHKRLIKALRLDRDEGVESLEVLIVFPFLVFVLALVLYVARYEYSVQVAMSAAEVGARTTAIEEGNDIAPATAVTDGVTAAQKYINAAGGSPMSGITVTPGQIPNEYTPLAANQIQFTIEGPVAPLGIHITLSLSQTAVATPETFSHG